MCQAYEKKIRETLEVGRAEGIELGKVQGIELGKTQGIELGKAVERKKEAQMIRNLMEKFQMTPEVAMNTLGIPLHEQHYFIQLV